MDLLRGYIKVNNEPILLGCVIILLLSESSNLQFRGVGCGKIVLTIERPQSSLFNMCGLQSMVSSIVDFVMSFCKMTTF